MTGVEAPLSKLLAPPKSWLDAFLAGGADSSSPCPLVAAPLPAPPACAAVAADTGGAGTGTAGGTTVGTSVWAAGGGGGGTAAGTAFAAAAFPDFPVGDQGILEMSEEGDRIETGLLGLPHPDRAVGGVPVRRCCWRVGEARGSSESMVVVVGAVAAMVARRLGEDRPVFRVDLARAAAAAAAVASAAAAEAAGVVPAVAAAGGWTAVVTDWRST